MKSHTATGRIRAGRTPAAHGGATLPCQSRKAATQETVKRTGSVLSFVPRALIRCGAAGALAVMLVGQGAAQNAAAMEFSDSLVRVDPCKTECEYVVTFINGFWDAPGARSGVIEVDGRAIGVAVEVGFGADPDTMTVTPPAGFWCSPCAVTVREQVNGASGVVEIFPELAA